MRADIHKDIPLAQAVEQANARFPDLEPLTEAEVVAAVRAIKLKYRDLPNSIYEVYQKVVNERILPRGMFFSHTSGWQTPYGHFDVDWKDLTLDAKRAGIDGGNLGFNYRIRARFISSRPLTDAEKQALQPNRDGRFVLHTEAGVPAR